MRIELSGLEGLHSCLSYDHPSSEAWKGDPTHSKPIVIDYRGIPSPLGAPMRSVNLLFRRQNELCRGIVDFDFKDDSHFSTFSSALSDAFKEKWIDLGDAQGYILGGRGNSEMLISVMNPGFSVPTRYLIVGDAGAIPLKIGNFQDFYSRIGILEEAANAVLAGFSDKQDPRFAKQVLYLHSW